MDDKKAPPAEGASLTTEGKRNLILTCIGIMLTFAAEGMLLLAIPFRALELNATPSVVGLVMSAPYLLPLVFAIPIGGVVSRVGSPRVFMCGALGMALAPCLSLLIPTIWGLVCTQVFIGISQILIVISAQTLVSSLGRGRALERYFGRYTTCLSVGQLFGPLLAGALIDSVAMIWVFTAIAFFPLMALICACFMVGNVRQSVVTPGSLFSYRAQLSLLKSNVGVQVSMGISIAVVFAIGAYTAFLPLYLQDLSFSASLIGMLISLRAAAAMLIRPFMSTLVGLLRGRSNTLISTVVAVTLGVMWTGTTDSVAALALMAILVGLGSGVSQPLSMVIVAEHVEPANRSSALGMRLMGNRGAQIIAPLVMGLLADFLGFAWTFILAGAFMLAILFSMLKLLPAFNRAEADSEVASVRSSYPDA